MAEDDAKEDLRLLAVPSGALCQTLSIIETVREVKLYLRVPRPRLDSLFLCFSLLLLNIILLIVGTSWRLCDDKLVVMLKADISLWWWWVSMVNTKNSLQVSWSLSFYELVNFIILKYCHQPHLVFLPGCDGLLVDPVGQPADPGESVVTDAQHGTQRLL